MARWLLKTEPSAYAWDDLVRDGRTVWDGITNPLALIHLRSASPGDEVLIYHTGVERRAVGLAKITGAPRPDPKTGDPKRPVVDIAPVRPLPVAVTLEEIKADPVFAEWALVKNSRLSFVPVPEDLWRRILSLSRKR